MPTSNKLTRNGQRKESPARHIRISDDLWHDYVRKAAEDGMGPSEGVKALLRAYVRGDVQV